jgi:hypothetical protein
MALRTQTSCATSSRARRCCSNSSRRRGPIGQCNSNATLTTPSTPTPGWPSGEIKWRLQWRRRPRRSQCYATCSARAPRSLSTICRVREAARYKRAATADFAALGALLARQLPELGDHDANRLAGGTVTVTGAIWSQSQPCSGIGLGGRSRVGGIASRLRGDTLGIA